MAEPNTTTPGKKSNNKIVYIIMFLLLLGLNVFMYFNNRNTVAEKEQLKVEKEKVDSAKLQLERDYQHALAEIEQYKGEKASLDSQIHVYEFALKSKKNEIATILMKNNLDKEDLAKALRLISELKMSNNSYLRTIDSFRVANQLIARRLDTVQTNLQTQVRQNDELKVENTTLQRLGSILRIMNVHITGENEKGKGKEKETTNIKRIDYLKITFDVDQNRVAEPGDKIIYFRITDPNRNLLFDMDKGSGTLRTAESNLEVKYTGKVGFNYDGRVKNISTKWSSKAKLAKGDYKVEYYYDGYLIATSSFKLSSGLF